MGLFFHGPTVRPGALKNEMSIACGIHVGRAVALAADTRTMMSQRGVLFPVSDSEVKVQFWGNGFIAGVGASETLYDAAVRLASRPIRSIDELEAALSNGWGASIAKAVEANPGFADLVSATALYTTVGVVVLLRTGVVGQARTRPDGSKAKKKSEGRRLPPRRPVAQHRRTRRQETVILRSSIASSSKCSRR